MSVNFADVNEIVTPKGNVVKIYETNGGRVLWEKKSELLYDTTTRLSLLKGLELYELKQLYLFNEDSSGVITAAVTSIDPTFKLTSQLIHMGLGDEHVITKTLKEDWFKLSSLKKNGVTRVKWFVDYTTLPKGVDFRYYEEGESGFFGDNYSFGWFSKKSYNESVTPVYSTESYYIDYWIKVKIVTNIGYDEKYIRLRILGANASAWCSESEFYGRYIANSILASDISESFNLG